ncbi:MAG: response regulator transcription factor [Sulfuricurvum sp.]|nr:response regulator transcription factor [Sulfuricurvum sp.]MDP3023582.1 response regulator transcription factor [Sulfuricurvum sp.]
MNIKILKNLNVLYVEDDPIISSHTITLLETYFDTVYWCESAEDALELFMREKVHLIISDIELPGMNGLQLCEKIRKLNPHIPIFITTAHQDKEMLMQAVKLKLVDYLIKPITVNALAQALSESLDQLNANGDLMVQIDHDRYYYPLVGEIHAHGEIILLNKFEIELLDLLLMNKNKIVNKTTIEHILNPDEPMSEAAYKNLIYRLRKKIGKENIVSVSGVGIKLPITR